MKLEVIECDEQTFTHKLGEYQRLIDKGYTMIDLTSFKVTYEMVKYKLVMKAPDEKEVAG